VKSGERKSEEGNKRREASGWGHQGEGPRDQETQESIRLRPNLIRWEAKKECGFSVGSKPPKHSYEAEMVL
jgi:hypothetical protein